MNNTIRINKLNKWDRSKKKKGGMPRNNKKKKNKNPIILNSVDSNPEVQGISLSSNSEKRVNKNPSEEYIGDLSPAKTSKGQEGKFITQDQPHENKTTRSISLIDMSENDNSNFIETLLIKNTNYFDNNTVYTYSSICPKKDGTPQKRLLYLAIACLNILDGTPFKNYGYNIIKPIQREKYKNLINFMRGIKEDENVVEDSNDSSRGWWGKFGNKQYLDSFNELVNLIIDKNSLQKNNNNNWSESIYLKIISSFELIILVKSISDTSQFGQLINFIPNLISPREQSIESPNISNIIKSDAKIGFDSADKICIGTSAILVNELPFPVTTMCPRKSSMGSKNIQNIIIQKGIIAALAITINILWNEENEPIDDATNLLLQFYDFENNNEINQFIINLMKIISDFKSSHSLSDFRSQNMNQLYNYGFTQKNKLEIDELISKTIFLNYETDYVFRNLSALTKQINNLLDINNLKFLETARDNLFTQKQIIGSSIWTYYLSTDVFKLKYPQLESFGMDNPQNQKQKTEIIKDLVSNHEIIMGTIDSTYGHDFEGIKCIKDLGERFMEANENLKEFILPPEVVNRDENSSMIMCLKKSNCVTIDQISNKLSYNFNPDENYLISNTELSGSNYLNIFDSIFAPNKPLVVSVDLVKGIQIPLVDASAESSKIISNVKAEMPLINPINPNEMQEIVYKQIQENGFGGEFRGSTNEFDGAGNYNTINPIIDANEEGGLKLYETNYNYKFTTNLQNNNELILKIETKSTVTVEEIENKFKENLISSYNTPTDAIFKILKDNYGLEKEMVINTLNENYPGFVNLYSDLFNNIKLGKNGNMKITTEDILSFINGCKTFIRQNTNIPSQFKVLCDSISKIPSKLNKDEAIGNFNIIIANIINYLCLIKIDFKKQLQSSNELHTIDNSKYLIDLFTNGIGNLTRKKIKPNDNSNSKPGGVFGINSNEQINENKLSKNPIFSELFLKNFPTKVTTPNSNTINRAETDPTGKTVSNFRDNVSYNKKNLFEDNEETKKGGKRLKKTRRQRK